LSISELEEIAREVRRDIIMMISKAKSGHPGGSLSCVEILVALYFKIMRIKPDNPEWDDRDRFILSKGHAAPALYSILSRLGYFPREWLWTLRRCNSRLQGHPYACDTPGVDASSGSLGQGLSFANGCALAAKLDKRDYHTYCVIGDGEIDEGQIWEASMTSSRFNLDNLTAILDHNGLQIDGNIRDIKNPYPLKEKWQAFGWRVFITPGHNFDSILDVIEKAKRVKGKPQLIIANTTKGKGVSFMENMVEWHGKAPNKEETERALKELNEK